MIGLDVLGLIAGTLTLNVILGIVVLGRGKQLKQANATLRMFQQAETITLQAKGKGARYVRKKR